MKIGTAIKKLRQERGLTQIELAQQSGLKSVTISIIENNSVIPNLVTMHKIAKVLDVNPTLFYFIGLEVDDVPEEKKEMFKLFYPSVVEMLKKLL